MAKEEKILDQELCFQLYVASKEIIKMYKPLLAPYGVTYTEFITLLAIQGEMTVNDLGKQLYLDSGTLSPLLKKLEKKELLIRHRSPLDERKVLVKLTAKGKKIQKELPCVSRDVYDTHFAGKPLDLFALLGQVKELNQLFTKENL
ncbi:MAG: MarR family winged helix-turn-helix transcriptional regulator [Enterococcaceae bacterium]|jgi:DNA-binding MarR family transcriptional regulator|nr:MarR family winged helix-turn-helix transcriptional regulator [Enterococcaceae bacterium]MCI1919956.1 MarR family winged helix-turn-helix transcriptional regulator [Enterococcaceae bacterium]